MVGTYQDALRALMNEKFTAMDTSDTYEKRVKQCRSLKMRLRQANPADLDAFFADLQRIYLESKGQIPEQQPYLNQALPTIQPKDDFRIWLAKDLDYIGIGTDNDIKLLFTNFQNQKIIRNKILFLLFYNTKYVKDIHFMDELLGENTSSESGRPIKKKKNKNKKKSKKDKQPTIAPPPTTPGKISLEAS
ncbi:hypothetical protein RclHR1_12370003 [Rhizophagus clarus]|uniref:Uncharacterized protein n=1 Tax=Rhizophagus clarus TaxID=94130 RepID=A0A2Z6Q6Z5_9GLOM|nr:hypothetical protein RclHR1_12370003 [Rhizophagus clarus]